MRIEVKPRSSDQTVSLEPVYIDSSLDREELYVQAQAVLTVKIHHSIPLFSDGQLSPLNIDGARVHSLGEPVTYQQYIHGIRYGVIEMRYAIFPQAAGTLTIASQTFTATLAGTDAYSLEEPLFAAPGRQIQVKSAQIPLRVNPPPAAFPADAFWLPASKLSLRQTIPGEDRISLDQALTHNLVLEVDGQPASALPSLLPGQLAGFRLYDNPLEHSQQKTAAGLQARQQEQQLLVALQPGSFTLPAIRLPWWNTETDSLQWATVDAHSLEVFNPHPTTPIVMPPEQADTSRFWQLLSLLLAFSSLLFAWLWRRARRLPAVTLAIPVRTASRLLDELKQACRDNRPQQARVLLDQWLRQHDYQPSSMAHKQPQLHAAMRELNQTLYAPDEPAWDGTLLWQAISELHGQQQQADNQQLPPLYPP